MAEALLTVSNVETYYGPIMALRGVSFAVPAGAIVTILGANGAGKTTILKTVSGVMDPQKGTITLEGRQIQGLDPDRVARLGLSHVPEGREVFPFLTVRENLRMGAYTRRDADGVARDLEMVVYCACPNEVSAAIAAKHLKRAGFKNIRSLLGGIDAWVQAGQPLEHALR